MPFSLSSSLGWDRSYLAYNNMKIALDSANTLQTIILAASPIAFQTILLLITPPRNELLHITSFSSDGYCQW